MFKQLSHLGLALGLVAGALAVPRASAQCAPDGLDAGACCAPAGVNLPNFPQMPVGDARWICFDDCLPAFDKLFCVQLGKPKPVGMGGAAVCGEYLVRIQLKDCATGLLHWTGGVRATYSRNWIETPAAGSQLTVWRFIVNGDLIPTNNVPNTPCERPASLSAYSRLYISGHIDYALDCATNTWSVAWAVSHECDQVHHAPGTARPAPAVGFDPGKSFSIVSPGSSFSVTTTNTIVSDGPITQGSMRWNNWAAAPSICTFRERTQGSFNAAQPYCLCNTATFNVPQFVDTIVTAQGQCGSVLQPSTTGRFTQKRIGVWSDPAVFPGIEHLLFDYGELQHINGCNGVLQTQWFEGSETIGGFPASDFTGVALGRQFEDLGSCNTSPSSTARRIGAPHIVHNVLSINLP